MKKFIGSLVIVLTLIVLSCSKVELEDPVVSLFSADPTTVYWRDTVTFQIDAAGDYIIFYDGKQTFDLTNKDMPYTHKVGRIIRLFASDPDTTIYARIAVTNVYDSENIKSRTDSIGITITNQQ